MALHFGNALGSVVQKIINLTLGGHNNIRRKLPDSLMFMNLEIELLSGSIGVFFSKVFKYEETYRNAQTKTVG